MPDIELPQTFKSISKRARLLLKRQEDSLVDFKETAVALTVDDLVAMANTTEGGSLLLGVREEKDGKGLQKTFVVGCPVDDGTRLSVVNKAQSAHPPISVAIFVENSDRKPFLRVEVLPSEQRPHCTPKGRYALRMPGRNAPLLPRALLDMFLEDQAQTFVNRFREAASKLEGDLEATKATLDGIGGEMVGMLDSVERQMDAQLNRLHATAEDGASMAEEAYSNTTQAGEHLLEIDEKLDSVCTAINHQQRMIDSLAVKMGLPTISRVLKMDKIIAAFGRVLIRDEAMTTDQLIRKAKAEIDPRLMVKHELEEFSTGELVELHEDAKRAIAPYRSILALGEKNKNKAQKDGGRSKGQKKRCR